MLEFDFENLTKKIKEAKETNNIEKEKILKGFSRLLSICLNIYKIIDYYEDCEEFEEIRTFFSFVAQILCNYIEGYIDGKKISLESLETILDCTVYEYAFYGFGWDGQNNSLLLKKIVMEEDEKESETLEIPTPITKTHEWYNKLKSVNNIS